MKVLIRALGCSCAMTVGSFAHSQVFVDGENGSGGGSGGSWGQAMKYLSDGIAEGRAQAFASPETDIEVWVAAIPDDGAYYPDQTMASPGGSGDVAATFEIFDRVSLYGGFDGSESSRPERDEFAGETILDGEIGATANSRHVVFSDDLFDSEHTTRFSGFTIRNGNAVTGIVGADLNGGGMLINGSAVGGLTTPLVDRCTFRSNSAIDGGGLHAERAGTAAQPFRIVACSFIDNTATDTGGGMSQSGSLLAMPQLGHGEVFNCLFTGNAAGSTGAGLWLRDLFVTMANCTMAGNANTSNFDGDGLATPTGLTSVKLTMRNCILWGNGSSGTEPEQIVLGSNPSTVDYSCIQGLTGNLPGGTMNTGADPLFGGSAAGNYRITVASPCLDTGDNTAMPLDCEDIDEDGIGCLLPGQHPTESEAYPDRGLVMRVIDGDQMGAVVIDMGAYEFAPCPPDVNGDQLVNVLDLLAVLALWAPCSGCPEDINRDGVVNVLDMLIVLAEWGPCGTPLPGEGAPSGIGDCISEYGQHPEKLAACIIAVTGSGN